jgi:hypothetical protein
MKKMIAFTMLAAVAMTTPALAQTRYGLYPATPGPTISTPDRYVIGPSGPGSSLMAPPTIERARPNESLMRPQYEFRPEPAPLYRSEPTPRFDLPSGLAPRQGWGR